MCSAKKVVLKNFVNFTRNHLCWNFFLINLQVSSTSVQHLRITAAVFLKSNLQKMYFTHKPKTLFSFLVFIKYFFTSSALQTLVSPNLCLLLRLSCMLNICKSSFSSSLNKLNALSPYQIFVPIGNAQNLISGFIQQSCVDEINTAP